MNDHVPERADVAPPPVCWAEVRLLDQYRRTGVLPALEVVIETYPLPELESVLRTYFALRSEATEQPDPTHGHGVPYGQRYRIVKELGRGGQGCVFLAHDSHVADRLVALKVLTGVRLPLESARARFERESALLGRIDHPGICSIHDAGAEEGCTWIAMQYLEGETLERRLEREREHPRPHDPSHLAEVERLLEETARALHVAHEAGVLHRDIKPGNVMITPAGRPVILDFGLARESEPGANPLTLTGDVLGTPWYMAPEQTLGLPTDRRSDVWSLGVVLFECLTLRLPFTGPTREAIFQAIRSEGPGWNAAVLPRDLRVVLETALAKEPGRRYRTCLDLAEDLRRIRSHEPIRARPASIPVRVVRWIRRNPVASALITCLSILLPVVLAMYLRSEKALARFHLLSGTVSIAEARTDEAGTWPPVPERVPAMVRWLREYGEPIDAEVMKLTLALEVLGAGPWTRSETCLREAVRRRLDDFEPYTRREVALVRERLRWAQTIEQASILDHASAWHEAIAAIAASDGVGASGLYRGLRLSPQLGLVPLGMDPKSRLWEFVHLRSGTPGRESPVRDPRSGELAITPYTGMVLVLLPGGTFWLGSGNDPGKHNFDPSSKAEERPLCEVPLEPFFLAKHEMTQGQWQRLGGSDAAHFTPGTRLAQVHTITLAHPIENVPQLDALRLLTREGLVLPTEAQWEYACRAGTETPWSTGFAVGSLQDHANLADEFAGLYPMGWKTESDVNDQFIAHAPVGSFAANPFGLHDMHGNVGEWCVDLCLEPREGWDFEQPIRPVDGLRTGGTRVVARGGSYADSAADVRSAARRIEPDRRRVGIRPAIPLTSRIAVELRASAPRFSPPLTVRGRILAPDGSPAIGASVCVTWHGATVDTGVDGAFELRNVPASSGLVVMARWRQPGGTTLHACVRTAPTAPALVDVGTVLLRATDPDRGWRRRGFDRGGAARYPWPSRPNGGRLELLWQTTARNALILTADLDGDGTLDLVSSDGASLSAYEADGRVRWKVPTQADLSYTADIDGDARPEIVTVYRNEAEHLKADIHDAAGRLVRTLDRGPSGWDSHMVVLDHVGDYLIAGYRAGYSLRPRGVGLLECSTGREVAYLATGAGGTGELFALGDLDRDGNLEIAMPWTTPNNGVVAGETDDRSVFAVVAEILVAGTPRIRTRFAIQPRQWVESTHAVGRLTACMAELQPGAPPVLVFLQGQGADGDRSRVFLVTVDGALTASAPLFRTGVILLATVVDDRDGDGVRELVLSPYAESQEGLVVLSGASLSTLASGPGLGRVLGAGDLDGKGRDEIVVHDHGTGRLQVLDASLTETDSFFVGPHEPFSRFNHFLLSDLTGDGIAELVVGAQNGMFVLTTR